MKCEFCEDAATIHVTDVDANGESVTRSLCENHATKAGFSIPSVHSTDQSIIECMAATNRKLADFLRENNRMPSPTEAMGICGAVGLPSYVPEDTGAYIEYLHASAEFMERHGRIPTDNELPDPF